MTQGLKSHPQFPSNSRRRRIIPLIPLAVILHPQLQLKMIKMIKTNRLPSELGLFVLASFYRKDHHHPVWPPLQRPRIGLVMSPIQLYCFWILSYQALTLAVVVIRSICFGLKSKTGKARSSVTSPSNFMPYQVAFASLQAPTTFFAGSRLTSLVLLITLRFFLMVPLETRGPDGASLLSSLMESRKDSWDVFGVK